jgi:hypothetical protein
MAQEVEHLPNKLKALSLNSGNTKNKKRVFQASMVVMPVIIPAPWEAEAGGSQVRGQPGQLSKTLSQKGLDGHIAQW